MKYDTNYSHANSVARSVLVEQGCRPNTEAAEVLLLQQLLPYLFLMLLCCSRCYCFSSICRCYCYLSSDFISVRMKAFVFYTNASTIHIFYLKPESTLKQIWGRVFFSVNLLNDTIEITTNAVQTISVRNLDVST